MIEPIEVILFLTFLPLLAALIMLLIGNKPVSDAYEPDEDYYDE